MELLLHSIKLDWPVLLPILICSILVVAVVINRFQFYKKNKRDVVLFIPKLQKELAKNNLQGAQSVAENCGGVIGEVTEEAVRIFSEQRNGFSRSFDIGATPPIVPKIVNRCSNFLVASADAISKDLEKPFFCSERILTPSSVTSPIIPPHCTARF